jgi:hypothetical protein
MERGGTTAPTERVRETKRGATRLDFVREAGLQLSGWEKGSEGEE